MKKNWYLVLVVILSTAACTQQNKDFDHCEELNVVDREMLDIIDQIEEKYKDDQEFLTRFKDAQIYWIQYKDRHVRAMFPYKKKYYKENFGMTYNYCKCKEWIRLTKLRNKELRRWLDGPSKEQEECPNSIL